MYWQLEDKKMDRQTVWLDRPGKKLLRLSFDKVGEEKELSVIVLGEEKGEYELEVVSEHGVGKTYGRVVIKGIAKNGAQVKVKGTIKIGREAQGVEDFLEMRLLILDDKSSAVAEPKLEIEANEVKASHAATVGRIDEEEVFYLMTRGICRESAEKMIAEGFLNELGVTI